MRLGDEFAADDASIHEHIVEEIKRSTLRLTATNLGQHTFGDEVLLVLEETWK